MDLNNKTLFELKQLAEMFNDPLFKSAKDQTTRSEVLVEIEKRQTDVKN